MVYIKTLTADIILSAYVIYWRKNAEKGIMHQQMHVGLYVVCHEGLMFQKPLQHLDD